MKGKKMGVEITDDCKTIWGLTQSGQLQSVCGQSITDFIYLFTEILHPHRQITYFWTTLWEKDGKRKLSNNLDNEITPINPAWFFLAVG